MKSLAEIIKCFKPSECDYIRYYYMRKNGSSWTKRLQLFDLIKNGISSNSEHACKLIYNHLPDSTFCQLKERLKKDLLNFMVFFPSSRTKTSPLSNADTECRVLLIQAKLLLERGLHCEAVILLNKVYRTATMYDIPDLKISAIDILLSTPEIDTDTYQHYCNELFSSVRIQSEIFRIKTNTVASEGVTTKDFSKQQITKEDSISPNFLYWKHTKRMKEYHKAGNVPMAYLSGLRAITVVKTNSILFPSDLRVALYLDLGWILMCSQMYLKAEEHIKKILTDCENNAEFELRTLELLFYIQFSQKKYAVAEELIERAMENSKLFGDNGIRKKWIFYKACVKFSTQEFATSASLLKRCTDLLKERSWLLIEFKVLELLNLVELADYDLVEYKIESFRKLVEYHKMESTDRVRCFIKLVKTLLKTGFNYAEVSMQASAWISEMKPVNSDVRRIELIDVSYWVKQKIQIPTKEYLASY